MLILTCQEPLDSCGKERDNALSPLSVPRLRLSFLDQNSPRGSPCFAHWVPYGFTPVISRILAAMLTASGRTHGP